MDRLIFNLLISVLISTELIVFASGQLDFWSTIRDIDKYIPLIGYCDRIVYAGVGNCLSNFNPTRSSKGPCCSYRRYRACISGLRDGHNFAVARKSCPPYSISMQAIWTISDTLIGIPLSSCKEDRNACKSAKKPKSKG